MERQLGRDFWKVLHVIAVNFPDGPNEGLSHQRLKAYYDFFKSLEYVLPRASWRNTWRHITASGETALDWQAFKSVRDHRQLSRWLYAVHDAVRHDLKQPKTAQSYAKLYGMYRKYRTGVRQQNFKNAPANANDATGLQKLKDLLKQRPKAMDTYMKRMYGDAYDSWTRARKQSMRKSHLADAAAWFWTTLATKAEAADPTFNSLTAQQRRNRILTQFDFNYRLRHQRLANAILSVPGALRDTVLS